MPNILWVEDRSKASDPQCAVPLDGTAALRRAGHHVSSLALEASSGRIGFAFEGLLPDLIVADVSGSADLLPLRHLRRAIGNYWGEEIAGPPCLAIVMPRHLMQPDWLGLLDDFISPPVDSAELIARVNLLLFRRRFVSDADTLRYAGTVLDLSGGQAFEMATGKLLPLTPREYDLLRFLLMHRGKYFGRSRLLDLVWGVDFTGGERTVDIHVRRLRAKLPPQTGDLLETRRSLGYGFVASYGKE